MPEILTESFCERCGTRYTFESTAPRKTRRLGQIKTLSKGMKNWVMSDDTSLDEAMAAARNDDDRALTTNQLDAFHSTFNFCMTCRQYTCGNCWNTAEGRCLTCAPHLGHEILPAPFPDQPAFSPVRIEAEAWPEVDLSVAEAAAANGNGHDPFAPMGGVDPWASAGATDVDEIPDFDPAARLAFLSGETLLPELEPEPSLAAEPEPVGSIGDSPESAWPAVDDQAAATAEIDVWATAAVVEDAATSAAPEADEQPAAALEPAIDDADQAQAAVTADAEPAMVEVEAEAAEVEAVAPPTPFAAPQPVHEPLPASVEGKADVGLARTADLLRRFRPGQNIDDELAAYEASIEGAGESVAAAEATEALAAASPVSPAPVQPTPAPLPALAWPTPATAEPEPEPIAAVAAEPEPIAAEPEPEPIAAVAAEPEPEPIAAVAAEPPKDDQIQQPTWQIYAPDATPAVSPPGDAPAPPVVPAQPPVAPAQPPFAASAAPQWPVRPDQTESPAMALLANRANRSPSEALWAASAQEVLATPANAPAPTSGVQPCSSCGLSLSATARFCRRCGTRQG